MPHIFPRKAYKAGEVADPDALNKDIQQIAEKAAAGLGEQDLVAGVLTAARIGANAYVQAYETKQGVTLGLTDGATGYAKQSPANSATVLYSAEWQVVGNITTAAELSKTIATGEDKLWILAQTQMAGWSAALGDPVGSLLHSDDPYRVQVALRVDEGVVEDTITGTVPFPDYPPRQLYAGAEAVSTSNDFDFRHMMWQKNGVGLPNHLQPCRVSRVVPVSEGSHTVSVVVRRLPKENFDLDNNGLGSCMQVFNRRLFVLRLKGSSKSSASSPTLTTPAFEDGDVLSVASLLTNRLNVVRDGLNDVPEAAIQRGALFAPHLPSCVKYVDCEVLVPAAAQVISATSGYLGYGSQNVPSWREINDGAGTALMVDNGGAGFTLTGNAGVIVVLANVQVVRLNVSANRTDYIAGVFIVGYKDNANVWNFIAETEAVITPRNESDPIGADGLRLQGITAGQDNCDEDVPLLWVVDTAVLLAANANASLIKEIKVFQATYDMTRGALSVNMETQRASLTAVYLLGVTLG